MNTETETKEALDAVMSKIDALIEAAPDGFDYEAEWKDPPMPQAEIERTEKLEIKVCHPLIDFPERHRHVTELRGDEWRAAYQKALAIAQSGGIVVAWGQRGTGKTQIAYEIATHGIFHDPHFPPAYRDGFSMPIKARPCVYVKAMDIFMRMKNGFSRKDQPSELDIVENLVQAAFLVIDEAHVRGETKYEDDKLTHIIDKRYDAMRPTMLITNLTNKDFAAQLSPSILSRITEIGGGIECNWQSYRKQTK
jgi:DNA replication protein DnaC